MAEPSDRPNFGPNQVRTLEGIKPGRYYIDSYKCGHDLILAMTKPVKTDGGDWVFGVLYPDREDPLEEQSLRLAYCSDLGIVKYDYGEYNGTNALLRTRRKPLTEEQVTDLLAAIRIYDEEKEALKL